MEATLKIYFVLNLQSYQTQAQQYMFLTQESICKMTESCNNHDAGLTLRMKDYIV